MDSDVYMWINPTNFREDITVTVNCLPTFTPVTQNNNVKNKYLK